MNYMRVACIVLTGIFPFLSATAQSLSEKEGELFALINAYRAEKNLSPVPFSPSLTEVAQIHAKDLSEQNPDKSDRCNMHSWSKKGKWTPCCYTRDHAEAACMWKKPSELTDYQGDGFEIAFNTTGEPDPEDALRRWKGSPGHHHVIINSGTWKAVEWNAMGVGIYGGYVLVWFGREEDPAAVD